MSNVISKQHLCFECKACEQICPKKAISMIENEEGFSNPDVDAQKCIDCNLCINVCPAVNTEVIKLPVGEVYAAQNTDRIILQQSSSGGIFSVIAEYVINKNGVVFGAAWNSKLQLHHIAVERIEELFKLRGSKYVHSDIGLSYVYARDYLNQGRIVYFTGTPCQIAGLKLFLSKDYPNLITTDLVCHGTPSQKIFNMFVTQMEKERKISILDYQFRDKKIFGWSCTSSAISLDEKKKKYLYYDKNMIAYFQAFIKAHITREDCYQCPFSCPERVGDITLADFWDVSVHHPEFPQQCDGVSLVIVNSERGKSLLHKLDRCFYKINSSIDNALATSNHNLKAPTIRPKERNDAYKSAFTDFVNFRDRYAESGLPEKYYYRAYMIHRLKATKLLKPLFKLIGKA